MSFQTEIVIINAFELQIRAVWRKFALGVFLLYWAENIDR